MVGVPHVAAERGVVERPALAQHRRSEAVDWDAQRADGVPDAYELDVDVGIRVGAPEQFGRDPTRCAVLVGVAVQTVRLLDAFPVAGAENAAIAHEPDSAPGCERAAAEAEEVQLVAGLVVLDDEPVALLHVARKAD